MRNLKRALSLTLASVMLLGMMVVGSSAAAGYDDVAETDNVEAIEVLQAIEVMVGDERGFGPERPVNRAEMAVVMGKLLNLDYNYYATSCPFNDVYDWARGYVGACAARHIVSGRGEGVYDPGATVTAVEAASMLMRALGYFQYANDVADGFELSTVRQGTIIGIFDGVGSSATEPMTRNQVAQMVLNALQSAVVEPDGNTVNLTTPDGSVLTGRVNYVSVTSAKPFASAISRTQATSVGSQNDGWIVELGERLYDGSLKLNDDAQDDFGRPSRAWEFDGKAIGTYAKKELIREEYSIKVTGKMLYELLTRNVINDYDLEVYVDGAEVSLNKNQLVRSNENSIRTNDAIYEYETTPDTTRLYGRDITGDGVETEVFVDPDAGLNGEITIVIVNTWLAKATSDYNSSTETATMEVYHRYGDGASIIKRVDVEDVPAVANLKEDDFVLVNWASDTTDFTSKDVLIVSDVPEVLTDVTVSQFSKSTEDEKNQQSDVDHVTDITTGGTKYSDSFKAFYEYATLGDYNGELLTKRTYDIYMDKYGYFIGATLHSGDDQYVFISAANNNLTSLGLRNSDALAIFVDGTMATINVNVTDTNKNIKNVRDQKDRDGNYVNTVLRADTAYNEWNKDTEGVNRWFTYTEDNGVYTLTPVTRYVYDEASTAGERVEIKSDRVSLPKTVAGDTDRIGTGNAYGDDDSVYITTDLIKSEKDNFPVDEVTGRYTGVQSVRLTYEYQRPIPAANPNNGWISAVYNSKNNIVAAVINGEAEGSTDNYAYILSGAKSEGYDGDYYTWTFEGILGGEIKTLTVKSRYSRTINDLVSNTVQELIFDTDGNVTTIRDIADWDTYSGNSDKVYTNVEYEVNKDASGTYLLSNFDVYQIRTSVISAARGTDVNKGVVMTLDGNTLHFEDDVNSDDRGLAILSGAKAVVRQVRNGSEKKDMFDSVRAAYNTLANARENENLNKFYFNGIVTAVLDGDGRAAWVYFYDNTPVYTGNNRPYATTNNNVTFGNYNQITYTISSNSTNKNPSIGQILTDVIKAMNWAWDETRDSIKSDNSSSNRYLASYRGVEYVITVVNNANQGGNQGGDAASNIAVTVDTSKIGINTVADAWKVTSITAPTGTTEAQIVEAIKAKVMKDVSNVASFVSETPWTNDSTQKCWTLEFVMRDGGHKYLIWNTQTAGATVEQTLNSPTGETLDNALAAPTDPSVTKKEVTFTGNTDLTGKEVKGKVEVKVPAGSSVTLGASSTVASGASIKVEKGATVNLNSGATITGDITGTGTVKINGNITTANKIADTVKVELAAGANVTNQKAGSNKYVVTGNATLGTSSFDATTEVELAGGNLTLAAGALPKITGKGTVTIDGEMTGDNTTMQKLCALGGTANIDCTNKKDVTTTVQASGVKFKGDGKLMEFNGSGTLNGFYLGAGHLHPTSDALVAFTMKMSGMAPGAKILSQRTTDGTNWTGVHTVASPATADENGKFDWYMLTGDAVKSVKMSVYASDADFTNGETEAEPAYTIIININQA